MRYYIATKLDNHEAHNKLRDALFTQGHILTYDWTLHGPVYPHGKRVVAAVIEAELKGVADADVVIVLTPGGRGTHIELGAALALGKKVYILTNEELGPGCCGFYWHPLVTKVGHFEELTWMFLPKKDDDFLDV